MAVILLSSDLNKRRGCLLYKYEKEVDSGSLSDVEILENPTYSKKRKLLDYPYRILEFGVFPL